MGSLRTRLTECGVARSVQGVASPGERSLLLMADSAREARDFYFVFSEAYW